MAENNYLVVTLNDGTLLRSENTKAVTSGIKDPLPGRPALTSGTNPLFEVESWSLGVSNPVTIGQGGGKAGKPDFADMAVMRLLDVATTTFFIDLCSGKSLKYVDLLITKAATTETVFAAFGFGGVFLSGLSWSGAGEQPNESVAFSYTQAWVAYRPQNAQGQFGPWLTKGWNRASNTAI